MTALLAKSTCTTPRSSNDKDGGDNYADDGDDNDAEDGGNDDAENGGDDDDAAAIRIFLGGWQLGR